jgi:Flp pilus assembly protein TadG
MRKLKTVHDDAGQALIETVIAVPLLLLILLAATEFTRATYAAIEVSNSARAAAQYAAMNGGAAGDAAGIQTAAQIDSPNLVTNVTATVTSDTCVCSNAESTVTTNCNANPNPPTCTAGGHLMETVTVTTQANFTPLMTWGGAIPSSLTLHGFDQEMVLQ